MNEKLLEVKNLHLNLSSNSLLPILQDIDFFIVRGEIFSLVGESGCGKSICCMSLTRILPKNLFQYEKGEILFENRDILKLNLVELQKIRSQKIAYVFQDPFSYLNPLKKIEKQMIESYILNINDNPKEAIEKATYVLNRVGISDIKERLQSFPHQLSGGMLQRVCIAMALMCDPILLIADEPTSAIDVTIQAQLVELLIGLKEEKNMTILFVSHDFGLVSYLSDRMAVMYAGQIVEMGNTNEIIQEPKHPYTQDLIQTVPSFLFDKEIKGIDGIVPAMNELPKGCHYNTRCKKPKNRCFNKKPKLLQSEERRVSCFLYE